MRFARPNGALSLALAVALAAPSAMAADAKRPAGKAARDGAAKYDPDNVTAISRFMEIVVKANALYVAKDVTAAIDTYKKAIELAPRNAFGHYMLAGAYLGAGNLGEADAAIQRAIETSDAKDAPLRARVLFVRAEVFERQEKYVEAKAAWQAYAEQAAKLGPAAAHPQTAAERIKALQRVIDLERSYAAVRARIAAEKADKGKKK